MEEIRVDLMVVNYAVLLVMQHLIKHTFSCIKINNNNVSGSFFQVAMAQVGAEAAMVLGDINSFH